MAHATAMPEMSPASMRPKPSFSAELEEIEGGGGIQFGDEVTLTITGKVVSMDKEEYGDSEKKTHIHIRMRLSSVKKV